MNWLLVIVGAMVGAPLRYLTDRTVQARWTGREVFPWGTFTVNAGGSLVLGLVSGAAVSSGTFALIGTGFCGALTTYSTFSYETLRLVELGRGFLAAVNVALSVLAGLGAVLLGVELARSWVG
ncbi:CrcB family protein [Streptomyces sp. SID3212]|uniref:CrcB family protein n=1 Tax=unclassified Streptomyces TaxID=2593676 RepID=UPI001368C09D|nr:CrcB protein [Streptomyces sp. SID3212]